MMETDYPAISPEALRESEERFRLTFDEAPIGMAIVGVDGRFLRVNRVLCELVGYTARELTGLTFQAITHPDDLDTDLGLMEQLSRGEIPRYTLGKRYIRKDGSPVEVMLNGSVLRAPDGSVQHYIAQIEDVSERKRVEREQAFLADAGPLLAESLDYERTLARIGELAVREIADICIIDIVADDGRVLRIGVTCRDGCRKEVCDTLQNVDLDRDRPHLMHTVLHERRSVLLREPSEELIASLAQDAGHLAALRAADIRSMVGVPLLVRGRMLGAMAFLSSSSSRQYDDADVRLAEELARRAALSIENARLYRAAQRATRTRDEVLGVVAHDLRNPLQGIYMFAKVLADTHGHPERRSRKPLEAIERAVGRMSRLIQDLLDVASIEAGQLSLARQRLSAAAIVAGVVDTQRPLAAAASLTLDLDAAADLPDIDADADRLLQVFENLIGNAVKFTHPGGAITLRARCRDDDVLFSVSDTGPGIRAEDVARLFDRYWQATRSDRRGAGLGLPIARGIIEAHGGRMWVESTPGEGSTFLLAIPALDRDDAIARPDPVGPEPIR